MTRAQRKRHRLVWAVMGPALVALLIAAVWARPSRPAAAGAGHAPATSGTGARP